LKLSNYLRNVEASSILLEAKDFKETKNNIQPTEESPAKTKAGFYDLTSTNLE